jgi:hypothetical protein
VAPCGLATSPLCFINANCVMIFARLSGGRRLIPRDYLEIIAIVLRHKGLVK